MRRVRSDLTAQAKGIGKANLCPMNVVRKVPSPDWGPSLWMLGGAAAGAALGISAFGRRDARV